MAHDQAFSKYLGHLEGWKVRSDDQTDPADRMQGNVKVSEDKQGVSKYHSKPVRIALFGLGRIGQIHLSNILANRRSTLLYCVETVPERQNYVKTCWNLNDVKFIRPEDADQVFMDPDVDAVIVGTPTFTHQEITMKALKAKKAVLCEKPLADSFEGMVECYKLAKANNVPLFCAFNRRFDPTYMECYNRLHSGEIGKLLTLKLTQKDSPFPSIEYLKHSGGFFHDSAIHDSDMMLWMTKQRPNKVYSVAVANFDAVKQINDFDTMVIVYSFPSGLICIGDLARQSNYGYDQRVELYGMDGVLFGTNRRPTGAMAEGSSGTKLTKYYESFASRYAEAYMNEIRHFVDAIQGKIPISVTGEDCLASHIVAQAAEDSARSGLPVYLDWENEDYYCKTWNGKDEYTKYYRFNKNEV